MEIEITRPNLYPRTCPNCPVVNKWIETISANMEQDESDAKETAQNASINVRCFNLQPDRYYTIRISLASKMNLKASEINTFVPKIEAICPGLEASLPVGVRREDLETD